MEIRTGRMIYISESLAVEMGLTKIRHCVMIWQYNGFWYAKKTFQRGEQNWVIDVKRNKNGTYNCRNLHVVEDMLHAFGILPTVTDLIIPCKSTHAHGMPCHMLLIDQIDLPAPVLDEDEDEAVFTPESNYEFRVKHNNGKWKYGIE